MYREILDNDNNDSDVDEATDKYRDGYLAGYGDALKSITEHMDSE